MKETKPIRLIAFDVDGTLTTGTLIIGPHGEAAKAFFARDGLAISLAHRMGFVTGLITGRQSSIVKMRQEELHMDFGVMGVSNKVQAMESVLSAYGLSWEEAAYMGDDWNDLALMSKVAVSGAPSDGALEVRAAADFVSAYPGGGGAARQFIEWIFKREGCWKEALSLFQKGDHTPVSQ